jgi:hypothetical protein
MFPLGIRGTVPAYQILFTPIVQEGEEPFALIVALQKKYSWVLDTISYDSLDMLIEILKIPLLILTSRNVLNYDLSKLNNLRLFQAEN